MFRPRDAIRGFAIVAIAASLAAGAFALDGKGFSQTMAAAAMESGDDEVLRAVQVLMKKKFFENAGFQALQPHLGGGVTVNGPISMEKAKEIATQKCMQHANSRRTSFSKHRQDGADHYFQFFEEAEDMGPMTGPGTYYMVQVNIFGALVDFKTAHKSFF